MVKWLVVRIDVGDKAGRPISNLQTVEESGLWG